jgi:hypothetical protein
VGLILLAVAAGTVAMTLTSKLPKWPTDPKEDLPPMTNRTIDAWAIRGVWCDLLRDSPVEIDPPPERDRNLWSWTASPELREVRADIPDLALLELGTTEADAYRLQVSIAKSNWDGQAGIFWSYRPIHSGELLAEWQAVTINGFPYQGKTKVRIHHEVYRREDDGRHRLPQVYGERIALKDLETPPLQDNILEIRIRHGRLTEVCWRGERIAEFVDRQSENPDALRPSAGGFGLYVAQGTAVFRDARFRLDKEELSDE